MKRLLDVGLYVGVVATVGYFIAAVLAVFFSHTPTGRAVKELFLGNPAANVGLPVSALAALAVVALLLSNFLNPEGRMVVEVLGFRLAGPGGAVALWIPTFLAFVFAIWLLKKS